MNLPTHIQFAGGQNITYRYDAAGIKLQKTVDDGNRQVTTDYMSGYQYEDGKLLFFPTPEGYVKAIYKPGDNTAPALYQYIYIYKDHLGNNRLSYTLDPESERVKILEENHYYPFGLKHNAYVPTRKDVKYQEQLVEKKEIKQIAPEEGKYKYLYNSKELQDELGLNWYDYQARNYDPALGRWFNIDPASELSRRFSPYTYALDNPVFFIDPDGMIATPPLDYYNNKGKKIGTDGVDDGRKAVVTNKKEARSIKKTNKSGGTTQLSEVKSAVVLPSDTALKESLNVLDRTVDNGGKKEESSLVMNDGKIIRGETGAEAQYGRDATAKTTLPNIPDGYTTNDVEATIHSHPTKAEVVGDKVYSGNALEPSDNDLNTFSKYKTNIIVGPLGKATATKGISSATGQMETRVNQPTNGVVIYKGNNATPIISLPKKVVEKIIKN